MSSDKSSEKTYDSDEVIRVFTKLKMVEQKTCEVIFVVKKSTRLAKLKRSFAERAKLELSPLRFFYYGVRIKDTDTPKSLQMNNDDRIDVFYEIGQSPLKVSETTVTKVSPEKSSEKTHHSDEYIRLKVVDQNVEAKLRVKKSVQLCELKRIFAELTEVESSQLRFLYDGYPIKDTDTPELLQMDNDDQIDVFSEMGESPLKVSDTKVTKVSSENSSEKNRDSDELIRLKVVDQNGNEDKLVVKKSVHLCELKRSIARRSKLMPSKLRFLYDGDHIKDTDTPELLQMDNDDQIDVFGEMCQPPPKVSKTKVTKVSSKKSPNMTFNKQTNEYIWLKLVDQESAYEVRLSGDQVDPNGQSEEGICRTD